MGAYRYLYIFTTPIRTNITYNRIRYFLQRTKSQIPFRHPDECIYYMCYNLSKVNSSNNAHQTSHITTSQHHTSHIMPRGKNYVNQNTGMKLQGKEQVKELCFYGNACTRKDCIYRHDRTSKVIVGNLPKSYTDPCMAYLAGYCAFDDTTCRKYHPTSEDEVNMLVQKYNNIPCKFTIHCKTKGCLYKHVDPNRIVPIIPQSQPSPMMAMMIMMHPNYQNNNTNHNTFTNHTFPPLTTKPNPVWSDPNAFPPLSSSSSKTTVSSNVVPPNHTTSSTSSSVITTVTTSPEDASQKSLYDNHYGPPPVTSNITTPSTLSSSSSSILKPVVPIDYRIKNRNIHHNSSNNNNNNNSNSSSGSRITTTNNTNVMYHHHNNNYQNGHVPPQHNHHVRGHDNDINPPTNGTSFNITAKEFIPGGASHAYRRNGN